MVAPARLTFAFLLAALAACLAAAPAGDAATFAWGLTVARVVLIAAFLVAVIAAIKVPGTGLAETLAVALLAALLVPPVVAGHAQWYDVTAIVAGVALIGLEVFVIPGVGLPGLLGTALLLGGIVGGLTPGPVRLDASALTTLQVPTATVVGGLLLGLVAWSYVGPRLDRLPGFRGMVLRQNAGSLASDPAALCGPAVGDAGVAATDLRPGGVARFAGSTAGEPCRVDVVTDRGFVSAGSEVIVVEVHGNRVVVRST